MKDPTAATTLKSNLFIADSLPINIEKNFKSQLNVILTNKLGSSYVPTEHDKKCIPQIRSNSYSYGTSPRSNETLNANANVSSNHNLNDDHSVILSEISKTSYKCRTSKTLKTISTTISTKKTSLINNSKQVIQNSTSKFTNYCKEYDFNKDSKKDNKLQKINKLIVSRYF